MFTVVSWNAGDQLEEAMLVALFRAAKYKSYARARFSLLHLSMVWEYASHLFGHISGIINCHLR